MMMRSLTNSQEYFSCIVAWQRATSPIFKECTFTTPVRPLEVKSVAKEYISKLMGGKLSFTCHSILASS